MHTNWYVRCWKTIARPRSTSRNAERTRGLLLQAAFEEIYRSGYRSADLDAILAAAGVTKGALYYHFDDKEALGYAVLDEVMSSDLHKKWVLPLKNAPNPIEFWFRLLVRIAEEGRHSAWLPLA